MPYIYLELQMELDPKGKNAEYFWGENNISTSEAFGRECLNTVFNGIGLDDIDDRRKFGINEKKVVLETILSVYENSIALEKDESMGL